MKKILLSLLTGFALTGSLCADTEPEYDLNAEATAVKTDEAPVIDGTIDAIWDQAEWNTINTYIPQASNNTLIPPDNDADLSGRWKALWNNNNLYVLVDVKDEAMVFATGNTLEIYTSVEFTRQFGQYGNPGYNGLSDFQIQIPAEGSPTITFGLYSFKPTTNTMVAQAVEVTGGYVMEVKLPWVDIGGDTGHGLNDGIMGLDHKWNDKYYMGFEVHLQDDDDGGNRDTKVAWCGGPEDKIGDNAWADTSVWGTLWLSEGGVPPTPESIFKVDPNGCSTDFNGGFKWNSAWGFIYDGFYPFVWSFDKSTWVYVFHSEGLTEQLYFVYNFTSAKYAWTGCPYYPDVYEL